MDPFRLSDNPSVTFFTPGDLLGRTAHKHIDNFARVDHETRGFAVPAVVSEDQAGYDLATATVFTQEECERGVQARVRTTDRITCGFEAEVIDAPTVGLVRSEETAGRADAHDATGAGDTDLVEAHIGAVR